MHKKYLFIQSKKIEKQEKKEKPSVLDSISDLVMKEKDNTFNYYELNRYAAEFARQQEAFQREHDEMTYRDQITRLQERLRRYEQQVMWHNHNGGVEFTNFPTTNITRAD